MSERRRLRATAEPPVAVPAELAGFSLADWRDPLADGDAVALGVAARRRFEMARQAWARDHGFAARARYGTRPGRDWWAFIALCRESSR